MPSSTPPTPPQHSFLGAFLSYLVPGLGQVYQGRVGKGVLFFVCVYALFFYGMAMGNWQNVYLPRTTVANQVKVKEKEFENDGTGRGREKQVVRWSVVSSGFLGDVWNRPQFLGQFWLGVAVWPAIHQYATFSPAKLPYGDSMVIEGYPPNVRCTSLKPEAKTTTTLFGNWMLTPFERMERDVQNERRNEDLGMSFERNESRPQTAPDEWEGDTLNSLQTDGDKRWDLGWVFTVIAGVLNIMVIYDAFAGPAFSAAVVAAAQAKETSTKNAEPVPAGP